MATTGGTQSRLDSVEWSNQNSGSRHYPEGQSMTSIPPPLDSAGGSSNAASPTRRPTSDEWPIGAMIGDLRAGYARGVEAGWDRQSVMAELFSQVQVPRRIGRFEITEPKPIGSGGMGKVFEGYDARLHRRVAIKLLECSCGLGEERFAREARALARLSHPNIVQVHEVGQHEEAMFIAMEYVEGQTLREWAAEGRSWAEVLRTYIEAGSGLAAAHAAGMVHRDFKPDNAMVGVDGRVRVLDFGLVRSTPTSAEGDVTSRGGASERVEGRGRAVESLTATGSVLGTVPYMAPEQHQGREVTPASDQYAFCVSVYEALYGTRPFGGETRFAVYDAIVQRSWQRPTREIRVPRRSIAAIRRGLAVEPEHRWPSMDALLAELQAAFRIKRLRLLGAGALLGALPAVGALWVGAEGEDAPCASFEERAGGVLPSVWDSERKTAIAEAFDSSGVPFAESSWSAVEAGIGRWVQRLARQRLDVCEAHHLRHEQSAEAMDLRMACLDRQQAELQAMVEVLASAEAEVVLRAPEAILELPRVEDCVDVERLRERVSGPDELVAAEVHEARESIDRARAMLWAGRYREGLAVARQALGRAERARYRPAASEARLVLGQLEIGAGAIAEGVVTLERSARDALRDRYDEVAAEAWARLARYASGMHALEAGRRWLLDAEVLYERLGRGDEDEVVIGLKWSEANLARQQGELSDAEHGLDIVVEAHRRRLAGDEGDPRAVLMLALAIDDLANVVHERGRYEEAVALHAEGLALHRAVLGEHHPRTGRSEYSLAAALRDAGRPQDALRHFDRALVALGPEPSVDAGRTHRAIAGVHHDQGRLDEATEHTRRAQQILAAVLPPDDPEQAGVWDALGVLAHGRGQLEESVAAYRQALSILERVYGPGHAQLGQTSSNLGESLVALGRFEEALPLFDLADRLLVRDRGHDDPDRLYPLKGRGLALLGLGRQEPAAEALGDARELCPPTTPTECGEIALGLSLAVARRDRDQARELAAEARRLLSDEAGRARMSVLLSALGDAAEVFDELR